MRILLGIIIPPVDVGLESGDDIGDFVVFLVEEANAVREFKSLSGVGKALRFKERKLMREEMDTCFDFVRAFEIDVK
jgi:hypothetical protein